MEDKIYEVIIPLGEVLEGSIVRKITGEKEYIVKRQLKIYSDSHPGKEIKCDEGCVFLVPTDGNICMYSTDKRIVWMVDIYTLKSYLQVVLDGPPQ